MDVKVHRVSENPQAVYQRELFKMFWKVVNAYELYLEEVTDCNAVRDLTLKAYCRSIIHLKRAVLMEYLLYLDEFDFYHELVVNFRRVKKYNPLERRVEREARFHHD